MPNSKHNCWKLSSVNLDNYRRVRSGVDRRWDVVDGGVAVLLLAKLLEERVLVDVDGRHVVSSSPCSGESPGTIEL
jgi:hypothetical protein